MSELRKYNSPALFYFPLIEDGDADFVTDYTPAAGDAKIFTDKLISTNPTAKILGFDSLSELPVQGAQIDENGAGTAEGVVEFTVIISGTVGGGDAAGFFFMRSTTGQAWSNNDQIDINGGTANIATADSTTYDLAATAGLIAEIGNGMFAACLSSTEMTCAQGQIHIVDSATKTIEDQAVQFHTYGNASALHAVDFDDSVRMGMTALPNAAAEAAGGLYTRGTGAGQINQDANGRADANVAAVSTDATAADNLELQYDTTGLAGDTFPATQSQLSQITNVGSAVHTPAESYVLTTGTQSANTVSSTEALDGTRHEHTDVGNAIDLYYQFNIGAGTPSSVQVTGYVTGNNDDLDILGFDWVASAWVQIGNIQGTNSATNQVFSFDMFVNMVGTGANNGLVRVRFFKTSGLTTALLAVDQIFVAFSQGVEGYENASVWVDTGASNTNTVLGIDGVARNPVSTVGAMNTLLASANLSRASVYPGSTLTFAAAQDNQVFFGDGWACALGGQSIDETTFFGADISGVSVGTPHEFHDCHLGACTFAGGGFVECGLEDTFTISGAAEYSFLDCFHLEAGAPSTLDFGAAVGASEVHMHNWHGNITILNMDTGDILHFTTADGTITLDSTCTAGTVNLAGTFGLTDNSSGMTINDNGQMYQRVGAPAGASVSVDIAAIKTETAAIDDLAIKKNTAFSNFEFLMVLSSDGKTPATGLTVTGERSIDGGAFAAVSGTIAEVSNGIYQFDALAADTNGDVITWRFLAGTADDAFLTFKTVA